MTITILIQNVERQNEEIVNFSFDEEETVHKALLRYLSSRDFPDILTMERCFFRIGKTEIAKKENFNKKLSDFVKKGQLLEFGIRRKDDDRHVYSEEAFNFADVSKGPTKRGFSDTAPDYRYVGRGLNIYGICVFKKCDIYKKNVIVMKGQCTIDLGEDVYDNDLPCPHCGVSVKPVTCGFHMCKYKINGKMVDGNAVKDIPEINGIANDENSSSYYNPDFTGMSKFVSLSIDVSELYNYK